MPENEPAGERDESRFVRVDPDKLTAGARQQIMKKTTGMAQAGEQVIQAEAAAAAQVTEEKTDSPDMIDKVPGISD